MRPSNQILSRLYQNQLESQYSLARRYKVSTSTMSRWLKEAGIRKRYCSPKCSPKRLIITEGQRKMVTEEYNKGHSRSEVSQITGVRPHAIRLILKGKFRKPWETKEFGDLTKRADPLPEHKLQCILGTLLGDGCLHKNTKNSYVLSIAHSHKQKSYVEHKATIIGSPVYTILTNKFGKKYMFHRIAYCNKGCLHKIASIVLRNNKKRVNPEWLNLLNLEGISYWYMDDGFASFSGKKKKSVLSGFSTEGFTKKEVILLQRKLLGFGIYTTTPKKGKGHNIIIRAKSINKFMDLIKPYVIPCLIYKIKYKTSLDWATYLDGARSVPL